VSAAIDQLAEVFGLTEGPVSTGVVLNTPGSITRAQAVALAKECRIEPLIRDLGALAAGEMANEMSAANLRAADFAEQDEIGSILRDRIVKQLLDAPESFYRALGEHLRARG
jgi:hypothetical protein